MDNKLKASQVFILECIIMIALLAVIQVPMLSWILMLLPVGYGLYAALTNTRKVIVLTAITLVTTLTFSKIDFILNMFLMYIIPGIIIGSVSRKIIFDEKANKSEPIYIGIIANMLGMIILSIISNIFFNVDVLDEYRSLIDTVMAQQIELFPDIESSIKQIKLYMNNILPTLIFIQSIITTITVYFIQIFIINKMKIHNSKIANFSEFYLPGNAVLISLGLYLILFMISGINIGLKVDLILMNLQSVFYFMFILQGLAVCTYYFKIWLREKKIKAIFVYSLIFGIFGVVALSFLGMLDSMNDIRKVRNYKAM